VKQEISIGNNPVYIAANAGSSRIYAISQGANAVTVLQTATNTVSNVIPVGKGPVYGVMTADNNRVFILNKTDGTASVINTNTNQLDNTTPLITLGAGPVWADTYYNGSLLVTANSTGNSVSVVSIPLCSVVALPSNQNCNANNPTDAANFGTVLGTVPVGTDPVMVTILQDGTRAYVANYNSGNVAGGSVSVVNLSTLTVSKTIPFDGQTTNPNGTPSTTHGPLCNPNFIASIAGTPTGKVYVTCPNSQYMTVIETDTDTIDTVINLQGNGVQLRVTATQ
jgi:YVTN family beta-propeller protein